MEKNAWHAMTAAPVTKGWPGYAIVFESSGHSFNPKEPTKVALLNFFCVCAFNSLFLICGVCLICVQELAQFAPILGDGMDGDPNYFQMLLSKCPSYPNSQ